MADPPQDPPRTPAESITPRPSLPSLAPRSITTPEPRPPPPIDALGLIPPGSSASAPDSLADSIVTQTTTVGGSGQTQVNVVNREYSPRPSTSDKQPTFLPQIQGKKVIAADDDDGDDDDDESEVSRSTANRTNISSTVGHRRPPSRSHVAAIMPSYSFYHPLRPPAVVKAEGQQQIPQTDMRQEAHSPPKSISPSEEVASVHDKPSTEALLPRPTTSKEA